MIDKPAELLDKFLGSANHSWCFTHILKLVAKSVRKQFDLPKARAGKVLNTATTLASLAGDIESEELLMVGNLIGDEEEDDNAEGLADIWDGMSAHEIVALDKSLQLAWLVLVKVNSNSN